MDWVIVSAVSTAVMTFVIFLASIAAICQLIELRNSRQLDAFINLIQVLQKEDIREARRILIEKVAKKEYKDWSLDERKQSERVCHTYDTAGIMSSKKHIDGKLVVANWHDSITKCWEAAKPMIMEHRKERGKDFWDNFEELYNEAVKYEKNRKIK